MKYHISRSNKIIKGEIVLPSSKSISSRLLMIRALCRKTFDIYNLSYSDDIKTLIKLLNSKNEVFDVEDAGSTMRLLVSYLANKPGEWIITGSERIKKKPIGILISALNELGVKVEYLEREGFPPFKIYGSKLQGGIVEISGSISSQFVSSLLLIAPTLPNGLNIKLKSKIIARPQIEMTLNLMKKFGVKSKWEGNQILIKNQNYKSKDYIIEADWSSASYWYEIAVLAEETDIKLYGLKRNSIQGDAIISELFQKIGIKTTYIPGGVRLRKIPDCKIRKFEYNFSDNPDLIQTVAVTLSALDIPFSLNGLETFIIKETNRIQALKKELMKIGCNLLIANDSLSKYSCNNEEKDMKNPWQFNSCNDYRLLLALAPLAIIKNLTINDATVVKKTYPSFWNDIQVAGFEIQEED